MLRNVLCGCNRSRCSGGNRRRPRSRGQCSAGFVISSRPSPPSITLAQSIPDLYDAVGCSFTRMKRDPIEGYFCLRLFSSTSCPSSTFHMLPTMSSRRAQHSSYVAYEPVLTQPATPALRRRALDEIQCNIEPACIECCGDLIVQLLAQAIWAVITGS